MNEDSSHPAAMAPNLGGMGRKNYGRSFTKEQANASITQSEYDDKIKRLYTSQKHTINKRDSHLFSKTLQELLTAQLGTKPRFLEKAAFLFKESARLAKQGQQNLHQFYSTTPRHLEDKQPRSPTVWPQTPLRSQTQLTTFFIR